MDTVDDALSTFGLDVDDASFVQARGWLTAGKRPHPDSIRVEEFINWLDGYHPTPETGAVAASFDGATSFDALANASGSGHLVQHERRILRVGVQVRSQDPNRRRPARVTALVDLSGSMSWNGKIGIVQAALRELAAGLRAGDELAILGFAAEAEVLVPMTPATERSRFRTVIDSLRGRVGGSTHVSLGVGTARRVAAAAARRDLDSTILVFTDGVETASGAIKGLDTLYPGGDYKHLEGLDRIPVTSVGVGLDHYDDAELKALARKSDGRYLHLDNEAEATRRFRSDLPSLLVPVAHEAQAQMQFDPRFVARWRLLGYGDRAIADASFGARTHEWHGGDSAGGDLFAGDSTTALYELDLTTEARAAGPDAGLGTLRLTYRLHGSPDRSERTMPVTLGAVFVESHHASVAECAARLAEVLAELPGRSSEDLLRVQHRLQGLIAASPGHIGHQAQRIMLLELVDRALDLFRSQVPATPAQR